MSEMSASNYEGNGVNEIGTLCEDLSPGRCPTVRHGGPGRYQASAKMKWSKELNVAVMECYFLSKPTDANGRPVRGYRRRMHSFWKERGLPTITEQRLCDQARVIRKNGWFTTVELEEIRRKIEEDSDNEEGDDLDRIVPGGEVQEEGLAEEISVQINSSEEENEQDRSMIEEIVQLMRSEKIYNARALKQVNRNILSEWVGKVNKIIGKIRTENLTETNRLIGAVALYVSHKVGLKTGKQKRDIRKEPWWKRRIHGTIKELRKQVNILQRNSRGELVKNTKYREMEKKYHIKRKGESVVIEELKQRLQVKAAKLRRYEQRVNQYRINRVFQQDQKKVYQELNGLSRTKNEGVSPDAEDSKKFWSSIWGNEVQHNKNAEWLKELKEECGEANHVDMMITFASLTERAKKIPNWKAPGPDGVQGYWVKKLTPLHERIAAQMNEIINGGALIPLWMTTGRTVLCQKDPQKGNAVDNYRPITCLPIMWKLMTGIIADNLYKMFEESDILPMEQKGCRRKSRGTKDQLLIDKMILSDCRKQHKNLAMAWVDYRKAYDMVPHSWIIECLKMVHVPQNITAFLQQSMRSWNTELTSCGASLGTVKIRRGIFQGDGLSPLIFVICMIPLSKVLRKAKAGYCLGDVKINHLSFMDDLKMFAKNKKEIDSLVSTVQLVSQDIGMQFGVQKCGVTVMKRGKIVASEGIVVANGESIKSVDAEGYRYLGILELDKIKENEMKEVFRREYLRRVNLVMKSKLNGKNKIMAINTWAVSLMRYGAGILKWNKNELQQIDRKTRKVMTINKGLHPRSDVARIYVSRKRGGRGLQSCEHCVRGEENSLNWYIKNSKEVLLRKVGETSLVNIEEAVEPSEYKKTINQTMEDTWKQKALHGKFVNDKEGVNWERSWQWIVRGDLKGCTEALIFSAQEQALRTNYIKFHIDKNAESPLCRMCGERGETISHLVSECGKLAQKEYKKRHDNVARYVHWLLCREGGFDRADKWYDQKPEAVIENENFKLLWDFTIQCDRVIEARRPDIVLVDKRCKEVKIIDIAVPGDSRVKEKELEKIEKYQMLREEIRRLWQVSNVTVIPVVVGALGVISDKFERYIKKLDVKIAMEVIQKTALLGTAMLLRKVLSL